MKFEVYKTFHHGKTSYELSRGSELQNQSGTIKEIASEIKRIQGNFRAAITCSPPCDISISKGNLPVRYLKLSDEEEDELFEALGT